MRKPPPLPLPDDDMDAMFGYPESQTTLGDLERKIDRLELKIDKVKGELTAFGIGAFVVFVLHYFNK